MAKVEVPDNLKNAENFHELLPLVVRYGWSKVVDLYNISFDKKTNKVIIEKVQDDEGDVKEK